MAIQLNAMNPTRVLAVRVGGKLTKEDYECFIPTFEQLVNKNGKIRVLFEMVDFHGWETSALWQDIKCDVKHFTDIERLAMVGDRKWEKGMSVFCKPFTTAKIRYFDHDDISAAKAWLDEE